MMYILYIENPLNCHYVFNNPSFYICRTVNPQITSCIYWRDSTNCKNTKKNNTL